MFKILIATIFLLLLIYIPWNSPLEVVSDKLSTETRSANNLGIKTNTKYSSTNMQRLGEACAQEVKETWVSIDERKKIWDSVVGGRKYIISGNGLEATYELDGAHWTIMGANAPVVSPTTYTKDWPVKGNDIEVLTIPEPITNYKILPFTEPIANALKSKVITLTIAPDSYEPASFVLRSGDSVLNNVTVEVSNLKRSIPKQSENKRTDVLSKNNVDIRVVKCWYQAGLKHNDVAHKTLTPELLLHDDDLIRVNYDNQLNLIRNYNNLTDADTLKPFDIPSRQNKQVWLTIKADKETVPGKYYGEILVSVGSIKRARIKLEVDILPYILPKPMLELGVYYLGYLYGQNIPELSSDHKTEDQMKYELNDMKEHGVTNATLFHHIPKNIDPGVTRKSWNQFQHALELRKAIGWGKQPLLYLDWEPTFKENLDLYKWKVTNIVKIAESSGVKPVYIYGLDEAKGEALLFERPLFEAVHEAGAKNFVACMDDFYTYVPDLLDIPVLHGKSKRSFMNEYSKTKKPIWVYSNIGALVEMPETYRYTYGVGLLREGFSGALVFAYQAFYWNDFQDKLYRSHTLAYPTMTKPIPTIQWEGWRQGINDIRYLTLLKERNQMSDMWLKANCFKDAYSCRKNTIQLLHATEHNNSWLN